MKRQDFAEGDRAAFLAALRGTSRKRGKPGGANLPRPAAHRSTGKALGDWTQSAAERLAASGWQLRYDARQWVAAWHTDGRCTAWYATLSEVLEGVERLTRRPQ